MTHICVCACTYKRAEMLKRLLDALREQRTDGEFGYSIVIADNDALNSARPIVEEFAAFSCIPITYCVEPSQNIARARNRAVANAEGDFIAFIDDDEFPPADWLLTLLRACTTTGVDAVIGPVNPHFDEPPPNWILKGKFYQRATHPTGPITDWRKGRVNNILARREVFSAYTEPFDPSFRAGEDTDFVRRMMEAGKKFLWCKEAAVLEVVPRIRWKRSFMLRRSLLQGISAAGHPSCGVCDVLKSGVAVPVYFAVLPLSLLCGQDKLMWLLVKVSYHLGKLAKVVGINAIKEAYIVD